MGKQIFSIFIYINHDNQDNTWSYQRLINEQHNSELQKIHEKHYASWWGTTQWWSDRQAGENFLDPNQRVRVGCKDMPEVKGCQND